MQQISKHPAALPYLGVMSKTAAFFGPGDGQRALEAGKKLVEFGAVAVPLMTLAASGISAAHAKMTEASRKANAFKSMVGENPHLTELPADLTQRYFNTLYRLNPELAHDPTVAASFVNNMVQQNNPVQPHAALYPAARELFSAGQKGQRPGTSFGAQLGETLGRLGEGIKRDRTEQYKNMLTEERDRHRADTEGMRTDLRIQQEALREQQTRNKTLKNFAQQMKRKAQGAGNYP